MTRTIIIVFAFSLAACNPLPSAPAPTFETNGVGYVFSGENPPAWSKDPTLPAQLANIQHVAEDYFGGKVPAGVVVSFRPDNIDCSGVNAQGCTWPTDPPWIEVSWADNYTDPAFVYPCVDMTPLFHEFGHAIIGDPDHKSPLWRPDAQTSIDLMHRILAVGGSDVCSGFAM